MIGVSSCLVGVNCTYNGKNNLVNGLKKLYNQGKVVAICPEVLGGLSTPRDPAEIITLEPLFIQTVNGKDVTKEYQSGAKKALEILKKRDVQVVVLKFRSPSCGNEGIYDGTFSHTLVDGQGVFVQLLEQNGIKIFNEFQINEFLKYIGKEEDYGTYFKD